MSEEPTVKAGAEPEDNTEKAGAEPVKDAKSDSSPENVPWNKDPRWVKWQEEKKTLQPLADKVNNLLKANNLDDIEDLVDLVDSGKKVKGKPIDLNAIDEIVAKAQKLDRYEAYWRDQEERKRREGELPDETIARLERELKGREAAERQKEAIRHEQDAARRAIESYEREVQYLIGEIGVPKE
jgi:hypothetical protein